MKKKLFLLIIVLLLTGCASHKNSINNTQDMKLLPHYKEEYKERYLIYKSNNKNFTNDEIVTYVNIGLDKDFYSSTKITKNLNKINILSNKYNYMPSNYIPNNLENINTSYTNGTKKLVSVARIAFEDLAQQAQKEGYTIRAISAYRSYDYQSIIYNKYVAIDGKELADTYSARPGYSEHQTGLAIDVDNKETNFNNFETTKEFVWMENNSYKYGFILRYPKGKENITGYNYEAWHYRYVGKDIAKYIKENNITYDEYYAKFID